MTIFEKLEKLRSTKYGTKHHLERLLLVDEIAEEIDGLKYHSLDELYDHRITLFIALCYFISQGEKNEEFSVWKSHTHSDGSYYNGWFIMGIGKESGTQIVASNYIMLEKRERGLKSSQGGTEPEIEDGPRVEDIPF